jgi:hypothetical protein
MARRCSAARPCSLHSERQPRIGMAGRARVDRCAELQADGYSCGNWSHYFRCRMLAYVADSAQLGTRSFAMFLIGDDLRDLHSVPRVERVQAGRKHRRFAQRRRDALRSLLLSAAQRGELPHGRTRLAR